ncbi:MAG: hypothetical protein CL928_12090, partial [Deltaproteobacteria bacterium]|nr:hypothetical protein [Deltaproteobacteria bacterium]
MMRTIAGLGLTELFPAEMSIEDKASLLDETPWSHGFTWEQILQLAKCMQTYRVVDRGVVFQEHEQHGYLCVVLEGRVAVMKEDVDEGQQHLVTFDPGSVFGEVSLIDGQPRSASVVAVEDSLVIVLTRAAFDGICGD